MIRCVHIANNAEMLKVKWIMLKRLYSVLLPFGQKIRRRKKHSKKSVSVRFIAAERCKRKYNFPLDAVRQMEKKIIHKIRNSSKAKIKRRHIKIHMKFSTQEI